MFKFPLLPWSFGRVPAARIFLWFSQLYALQVGWADQKRSIFSTSSGCRPTRHPSRSFRAPLVQKQAEMELRFGELEAMQVRRVLELHVQCQSMAVITLVGSGLDAQTAGGTRGAVTNVSLGGGPATATLQICEQAGLCWAPQLLHNLARALEVAPERMLGRLMRKRSLIMRPWGIRCAGNEGELLTDMKWDNGGETSPCLSDSSRRHWARLRGSAGVCRGQLSQDRRIFNGRGQRLRCRLGSSLVSAGFSVGLEGMCGGETG